jgi:hypothetical protein
VAAALLSACNDDPAPVTKDVSHAEQVTTGATVAVNAVPDEPAVSTQGAAEPNARLLRPSNLAPRTATRTIGAGVSARIDVFYDQLGRYGSWVRHPDFSYVWLPERQGRGWRPYQEGRWLWTDEHGWYWESSEPFAWAVYHYGRWGYDPDLGWFWVPGDTWSPAWVTWHHGGGRTGWAPLAPDRKGYAIGVPRRFVPPVLESWVFVDDRNFADPALGQYVLPIRQIGALLGAASDVEGNRGMRREEIERWGGRRIEKREFLYVGNDGDTFEDVRGGRIGIYRPIIEAGEARQPPHVVVTDVSRVDRVVIREYTDIRGAGSPSVALLTVLDKNERQRLQDQRLNEQAAAVDEQIARLQRERAAAIEERRREAERLQGQIDQERQEAALQRKQEQQHLSEARRQRAETITVDLTPAAAPPAAPAAQPSPTAPAAPSAQQAPARNEHVAPPAAANAPTAAKSPQTSAVTSGPATPPAAGLPAPAPPPSNPSPEAKTPPTDRVQPFQAKAAPAAPAAPQPASPAVSVAPVPAPAKPVPPAANATAVSPPLAPPVSSAGPVVPGAAPPGAPTEIKTAPVAPAAHPVSPATSVAPVTAPAKPIPAEAKATAVVPPAPPVSPAGPVVPGAAPPGSPTETKTAPAAPPNHPVSPATSVAPVVAAPTAKSPKAVQAAKDEKSTGKPNAAAAKNTPTPAGSIEPAKPAEPAKP